METLAENNERIGRAMAIGEILYSYSYNNGDIEFETGEQGVILVRDGKNILEPFQKGKVLDCSSYNNGDFQFITEKQGVVKIKKEEVDECFSETKIKGSDGIDQIIEFIDYWRKEHYGKFKSGKIFWEFMFRDLKKEFNQKTR